jgi:hypothetical protein
MLGFLFSNDWKDWFCKLKWQFISFKFLAFWTFVVLLAASELGLIYIYKYSIRITTSLFKAGYITKDHVATIITHTQTTLFDIALSHLLVFFGAAIASIIAIKGVSYWTNSKQTSAAIDKVESIQKEDLKQYLPKKGQ